MTARSIAAKLMIFNGFHATSVVAGGIYFA